MWNPCAVPPIFRLQFRESCTSVAFQFTLPPYTAKMFTFYERKHDTDDSRMTWKTISDWKYARAEESSRYDVMEWKNGEIKWMECVWEMRPRNCISCPYIVLAINTHKFCETLHLIGTTLRGSSRCISFILYAISVESIAMWHRREYMPRILHCNLASVIVNGWDDGVQ